MTDHDTTALDDPVAESLRGTHAHLAGRRPLEHIQQPGELPQAHPEMPARHVLRVPNPHSGPKTPQLNTVLVVRAAGV
ncbi:hypothetical protein FHU30_004781 [Actinomadura rupiterrae]|nr:hypothetical protein [Actinomadura rupiterrae]